MNYYQDEKLGYSNFQDKNKNCTDRNHSCCFKKVEESFYCFPSYYNEDEKKDDRKEEKCWEGTFKICPRHDFDSKSEHKDEKTYRTNNCNCCFNPCSWFKRW